MPQHGGFNGIGPSSSNHVKTYRTKFVKKVVQTAVAYTSAWPSPDGQSPISRGPCSFAFIRIKLVRPGSRMFFTELAHGKAQGMLMGPALIAPCHRMRCAMLANSFMRRWATGVFSIFWSVPFGTHDPVSDEALPLAACLPAGKYLLAGGRSGEVAREAQGSRLRDSGRGLQIAKGTTANSGRLAFKSLPTSLHKDSRMPSTCACRRSRLVPINVCFANNLAFRLFKQAVPNSTFRLLGSRRPCLV